jgi:hypothetical protein
LINERPEFFSISSLGDLGVLAVPRIFLAFLASWRFKIVMASGGAAAVLVGCWG